MTLTHVGRYELVEELGRGAMGVVFKALDPTIGRTVAIKAIRLGEFHDREERERVQQRLWREARSAGVLSHPNIVTIYDVLDQDSSSYIVMEYVNGYSLAALLARGAMPNRTDLLFYLRQVAQALDYAHQRGVIHRDVKPGNIMISDESFDGRNLAKVADFGVAKFISQDTTHSGTMIGTPSYLSPEQIEGYTSDGRSDQFSLAVVVYEVLTGQKPFDSDNLSGLFYQICKQSPKPVDQLNPQLPTSAAKVLNKGLAKEPEQRFSTCSDLIVALEAALRSQALESEAETLATVNPFRELPAIRPRRQLLEDEEQDPPRRRTYVTGLLVLTSLLVVIAGVAWQERRAHLNVHAGPAAATRIPSHVPNDDNRSIEEARKAQHTTFVSVPASGTAKQSQGLKRLDNTVTFQTEPPGATVQVDNDPEMSCVAPCAIPLKNGRHTMMASEPGFSVARRILMVPDDHDLTVILERSMGVLLMTSEPSGSIVSVDGKTYGQTPVRMQLTAGTHQLLVTNGEQRHEESVTVVSDEFMSRNLRWQ